MVLSKDYRGSCQQLFLRVGSSFCLYPFTACSYDQNSIYAPLYVFFLSRDYSKHSSPRSERIAQGERQHKLECLFVCISVDFSISMIHVYCTYRMIGSDGELRVPGPEHKLLQASNGPAPAARFVPLQVLLGKTGTHGCNFIF